jgi:phosphate-selective porin OprO and OprP
MKRLKIVSVVLSALAAATVAHADITVDVIGETEISFEGVFQADKNWFSNDFRRLDGMALTPAQITANRLIDDGETRRAELIFKGRTPTTDWSVAYEARANRWLDVFYRSKFGSYSSWQLGQFKQPNSLEELATTKHNDFIAKAAATNLFGIARRTGAQLATGGEAWTLTGSAFSRELTNNAQKTSGYGVRATFAPLMETLPPLYDAQSVLHFGLSYIDYTPSKDTVRLNARPEADLANVRLIDTLNLTDVDGARQFGVEAMYLRGPLKIAAEYVDASYTRKLNPNYGANSWYVSGIYNLTGDKFQYRNGMYTMPVPGDEVAGLWQVGARFSRTDLNDRLVQGGKQDALTLGVNWYWRLNFKFMANYNVVKSQRGLFENDPSVVELRAQIML